MMSDDRRPRWWQASQVMTGIPGDDRRPRWWQASQVMTGVPGDDRRPRWWQTSQVMTDIPGDDRHPRWWQASHTSRLTPRVCKLASFLDWLMYCHKKTNTNWSVNVKNKLCFIGISPLYLPYSSHTGIHKATYLPYSPYTGIHKATYLPYSPYTGIHKATYLSYSPHTGIHKATYICPIHPTQVSIRLHISALFTPHRYP